MQKDAGEDEDSDHHGEGRSIVGVGARNESLVLGMLERSDGDLRKRNRLSWIIPKLWLGAIANAL